MKTKVLLISLLALILIALTGCSGDTTTESASKDDKSDIVGTWVSDKETFEFNEDGTYTDTIEADSTENGEEMTSESTGTYEVDGEKLILTSDAVQASEDGSTEETNDQETAEYTYKVEDDQLTLEDANGYSMTFTKDN